MTKKTETIPQTKLAELKTKLASIRLSIKAGQEKNTNAHKDIKKEIAQLLTKTATQ